jgi:hypothetical protein
MDPTRLPQVPYGPRFGDGARQEPSMERRAFMGIMAGGLLVAPRAAEAQEAGKVARIGYLVPGSLESPEARASLDAFRQGLREQGYVEGQNLLIEYRGADGKIERLPGLAIELARLKLDLIVAGATPGARAAKQATPRSPSWRRPWGILSATGSWPASRGRGRTSRGRPSSARNSSRSVWSSLRRRSPRCLAWLSSGIPAHSANAR